MLVYVQFEKNPFPLPPSAAMYCVLCYRLKMIYKTQRIIKQSICATEHACLQFSPKRHSSIWTLKEFRSCVFMLWEATEGLSAAVSPQKTKRADKVKRKASLLFHIIVSGRNNCLKLLQGLQFPVVFHFRVKRIWGERGRSKTWTLMLNRYPFGGSSKGSGDETCSTPRLACPSTTGKPKWHRHYGVVSSANISKWSKWARQSPREQKRSELTLAEC